MDSTKKLLKLNVSQTQSYFQTQSYLKCLSMINKIKKKHIAKPMMKAICFNLEYGHLKNEKIKLNVIDENQDFSHIVIVNSFCSMKSFALGQEVKEKQNFLPINSFSISTEPISHALFDHTILCFQGFPKRELGKSGLGYCKQQCTLDHNENEIDDYAQQKDYELSRNELANTPRTAISFFQALRFCNALSKKHGLTPYYNIDDDDWVEDDLLVIAPSDFEGSGYEYDNFLFNPTTFDLLKQEKIEYSELYLYDPTGEIITKENYNAIVEVQKKIKAFMRNSEDEVGEDDDFYDDEIEYTDGKYLGDLNLASFSYEDEQMDYQNLFNEIPPTLNGFAIEYDLKDFQHMAYLDQTKSYHAIYQTLTIKEETKNKILINENANGYRLPYSWELLYIVGIENQSIGKKQKYLDTFDVHNPLILDIEYNQSIDLSLFERFTQDDLFFLAGYAKDNGNLNFYNVDLAIDLYKKSENSYDDDDYQDVSTFNDTSTAFLSKTKNPYDLGIYDVIGNTRKWVGDSLLTPKKRMSEINQDKRSNSAEIISRDMVGMTFGIGNSNYKKLFEKCDVFDSQNPYKINLFDKNGKCNLMDVEHAAISQDDISMFICKNIPKEKSKI